jgi:hypothetical protein
VLTLRRNTQKTPLLSSYFNFLMAGHDANLGTGSQSNVAIQGAKIPFDFALTIPMGGSIEKQAAVTTEGILEERLAGVISRNSGTVVEGVEGGFRFASRRAARQAASEMAGDLGSAAEAITAKEFENGPKWMLRSNRVIGRTNSAGTRYWRDDFVGHPRLNMGPHVNVLVDGMRFHFFY